MTLDVPQFALHVVGIICHPSLVKSVTNTIGQELWLDKICPNKITWDLLSVPMGKIGGWKEYNYIQYIQKEDSSIKHIYKFQAPWCTLLLNITKPCPKQWLEAQTIQPRRIPPVLASQAAKCKSHATLLIGKRLVARTLQRQSSAAPGGGWWWWWLVQERKQSTPVWYLLHSSNISHLWKRKLFPITFGGAKSCRKKEGFSVYQLVIAWSSNPGEERTLHTTRSARW